MGQIHLYMVLHGNLGFSSIPKDQYSRVLDVCYWPMIKLIEDGCLLGIEFPAETLLEIQKMDPSFLWRLTELWNQGKCEIIGSGFSQIIMPLAPYKVNRNNLELGMVHYEKLLGNRPKIAFIPEQTFSRGIPSLYEEMDFIALIMDWDNATEYNCYPAEYRYRPALVSSGKGKTLPVIWNSSMNSYKFQRYIYGRISLFDYMAGIMEHMDAKQTRTFCLYGTDWEIFNYRPVTQEEATGEIERVKTLFEALKKKGDVHFCLPSQTLEILPPKEVIEIASPEIPVPTKNRDDYNVVRWAVSGRDDVQHNTRCYDLFRLIEQVQFLDPSQNNRESWMKLVKLWGSDFRTKTTDEKHHEFWTQMGSSYSEAKKAIADILNPHEVTGDVLIYNLTPYDWKNEIVEVQLYFDRGRFHDLIGLKIEGEEVPSQCERIEYYHDGSLRRLWLVFCLSIKSGEVKAGQFIPVSSIKYGHYTLRLNGPELSVSTSSVSFQVNTNTGADIRQLVFNQLSPVPFIKYLPPVYFDNIAYSNDYFSGWSQLCNSRGQIFHDTVPTTFRPDPNHYTLRIPLYFRHAFLDGWILKRYDVYLNHPRLDLTIRFFLPDVSPLFLRTGIVTLNPEAFDGKKLHYSTVNGGKEIETFALKGKKISHTRFQNQICSATSCLGSTEGWVALHDDTNGLAVITPKYRLYSVPMVDYEDIKNKWLCRLYHSIAESDDTGRIFIRGLNEIRFTFMGFSSSQIEDVRKKAYHINHPSIVLLRKK